MSNDPFTAVERALWESIESNPDLMALVNAANFIKLVDGSTVTGVKPYRRKAITNSDLPEIAIRPLSMRAEGPTSSCQSGIVRIYQVIVSTGTTDNEAMLNPIEFQLLRSMHSLERGSHVALPLYNGHRTVQQIRVDSAQEGTAVSANNRNIQGYAASWLIAVTFTFSNSDLLIPATSPSS